MRVNISRMIDFMCRKNLSQDQLAKESGVRPATITAILKGKSDPTIQTINKIATCFECNPSEIVEV